MAITAKAIDRMERKQLFNLWFAAVFLVIWIGLTYWSFQHDLSVTGTIAAFMAGANATSVNTYWGKVKFIRHLRPTLLEEVK